MVAFKNNVARPARDMCGVGVGGVGVGWGGIIANVVVVLKKSVKRCGCFQEQCSTPRARYVWSWGGGGGGGVGRDNCKRCSCIEEECETLWLLARTM